MKHKTDKNRVLEAIEELRKGRMVILVDDEDRENEGDLTIAAEKITPEAINFMTKYGRGLICLAVNEDIADQLQLPPMVSNNTSRFGTAFTVSIEAKEGVTTGISAKDRATTIKTAVNKDAKPTDLVRPGHIFPIIAKKGGVLVRTGQTEGSVDLMKIAGMRPAAVICEILKSDGTMARMKDLRKFAKKHGLLILTIQEIIEYRTQRESLIKRVATATMPVKGAGDFKVVAYESDKDRFLHVALIKGKIKPDDEVLVRVHSECFTGDVLGSLRCDCGAQLELAINRIAQEGKGVILYMRQEGRGIGLLNKIKAYELQDKGADTVEANEKLGFRDDLREYGIGAQILSDIGVRKIRLMTNNPRKIVGLEGYGISVVEKVSLEVKANKNNVSYLKTKRDKMGHTLKNI